MRYAATRLSTTCLLKLSCSSGFLDAFTTARKSGTRSTLYFAIFFVLAGLEHGGVLDVVVRERFHGGVDGLVAGLDAVVLDRKASSGCR